MTSRGGGNPILDMAFEPRFRMGPPPRSFAPDAHDCIMVPILTDQPNTSLRREVAPDGELLPASSQNPVRRTGFPPLRSGQPKLGGDEEMVASRSNQEIR
jgi:hypothetical protein